MTNFEKYKDKLMAISIKGHKVALVKQQPVECHNISCTACDLYCEVPCDVERLKWLYEEYKEPAPKLTLEESTFLKLICYNIHHYYICRDKNNTLWIHTWKPHKDIHYYHQWCTGCPIQLDENFFKFIKWEDEEPWLISDLLALEVER